MKNYLLIETAPHGMKMSGDIANNDLEGFLTMAFRHLPNFRSLCERAMEDADHSCN